MNWPSQEVKSVVDATPAVDPIGDKIARWKEADTNQKAWRELELKLRGELVAELFPRTDVTGTEHHELGNGWKLSVTKGVDYKLDSDNVKMDKALESFDDSTAALLVKWEPKLSVANYKKLSEADQAKFAGVLTTKPSSPQLKLVEPK